VLDAYKKSHDWSNCEELDARNAANHPKPWEELCALVYNDDAYEFNTNVYKDLHDEYRNPITITTEGCPMVTPDKIKEKMSNCRAKLVKIVTDWEKSGNGFGQRDESDIDYGHITEDQWWLAPRESETEFVDGDNWKKFYAQKSNIFCICGSFFMTTTCLL